MCSPILRGGDVGPRPDARQARAIFRPEICRNPARHTGADPAKRLLDPGKPDTDRELADALHASRSVIGAVALFDPDDPTGQSTGPPTRPGGDDFIPAPARILWPQDIFRRAIRPPDSNSMGT